MGNLITDAIFFPLGLERCENCEKYRELSEITLTRKKDEKVKEIKNMKLCKECFEKLRSFNFIEEDTKQNDFVEDTDN